jgi:hypothetical protein
MSYTLSIAIVVPGFFRMVTIQAGERPSSKLSWVESQEVIIRNDKRKLLS